MTAPGRSAHGGVGRWQVRMAAASALVLTFFAGLALGWGISRRSGWDGRPGSPRRAAEGRQPGWDGQRPPRGPRGPGGPGGPGGFGPLDQLNLTAAQRTTIDSIFAARRQQIDAFWRGDGQRLRQIIDSTGVDVRAVLDPSQRATFDSLRDHHRRRRGRD